MGILDQTAIADLGKAEYTLDHTEPGSERLNQC